MKLLPFFRSVQSKFTHLALWKKITLVSLLCIVVLLAIVFGFSSLYNASVNREMLQKLELLSKKDPTVLSCAEVRDINFSKMTVSDDMGHALDLYNTVKNRCSQIRASFNVLSFFDPENDFRSTLTMNFSLPIERISGKVGTDEYRESEKAVKERMLSLIHFSPEVTIDLDDVGLYDNKLVINLFLEPVTGYHITFDQRFISDNGTDITSWDFMTPENKMFLLRTKEKVSLYNTFHPPVLELLLYDTDKKKTSIQVCSVDLETYGKIEVIMKNEDINRLGSPSTLGTKTGLDSAQLNVQEDFFYTGIDALKKGKCENIAIEIPENSTPSKTLIKKVIDMKDTLSKLGGTGLFMVVFQNKEDRNSYGRTQSPLLLGSINAHTTMKVGQDGEVFFFVNDFTGKPIEGMEMTVSVNEFSSKETTYGNNGRTEKQKSPLEKPVYSKSIVLGKTDKDGILKADLRGKMDDSFAKTFVNSYEFDESGKYNSFFVTGKNAGSISYVSSQWNGGIAPWNFGYKVNSWYYATGLNTDNLNINLWNGPDAPYFGHLFTERLLYLPGETVSIKAIIRTSKDLSVPSSEEFTIQVLDTQGQIIKTSNVRANQFGSVFDTFALGQDAVLGSYTVILAGADSGEIYRTSFSVEVFKNPKFTTDITLTAEGLDGEYVAIDGNMLEERYSSYYSTEYTGKFMIHADLIGRYYSGGVLSNAPFDYKVYRQEYYDFSYWSDCYYGCFWEPQKEFYTEGNGILDANGGARLDIPVDFKSQYSDYRYIVEVTPRDAAGDIISSSNSLIAKLPTEFKSWDPNSSIVFSTQKRFIPAGESITLEGKLNQGKWSDSQENKYVLVVKKKVFEVQEVMDVRGFKRPITTSKDELIEIIPVSKERFTVNQDGTVKIDYKLPDTAEYIFEFGSIDSEQLRFKNITIPDLIKEFNKTKEPILQKDVVIEVDNTTNFWTLSSRCIGEDDSCEYNNLIKESGCDVVSSEVCLKDGKTISLRQSIDISSLMVGKQFLSILTYSDTPTVNPVVSDNKIQVLSEKVSYKIGEKARILVRLPFAQGKILWTVEKRGVEKSEYIDVPGNIFFREVLVDESFTPNAYIGVVAVDTDITKIPEYKVGYTEVVVDKTDKKSVVTVSSDKKIYTPRETVTLNLHVESSSKVKQKSELAVMVVDDSLVSMIGNIDINTLEKIWRKLPFQIQTSITNIAMLRNYYFARPGIVGGSGAQNNKGGDSAASSRSIFKNTAYYNGSVVTDESGNAKVSFTLPDNLTQFRVIVISNSIDNTYGAGESFFSVQKPVTFEDKTPLIIRDNDRIIVGGNLFNQSGRDMNFTVKLVSSDLTVSENTKKITLKDGANTFVTFNASAGQNKDVSYTMSAFGDGEENSDSVAGTITYARSPTFMQRVTHNDILAEGSKDYDILMPENTLIEKSTYQISLSTNPIQHLESIVASLLVYPYGCIEQTVSSTVPNVLAKKFSQYFTGTDINLKKADVQIQAGLERIASMQVESGGFAYWQGDSTVNSRITPYVLRSLLMMRDMGAPVDPLMIERATGYLMNSISETHDMTEKAEIFHALALAGMGQMAYERLFSQPNATKNMSRHDKIAYTYGLFLTNKEIYSKEIDSNIATLKTEIQSKNLNGDYWYWDTTSDKAQFVSLLMDIGYDEIYVNTLIKELASNDYSGYYISTQSKNASFGAFIKYMEKYGKKSPTPVEITLAGKTQKITLSKDGGYKKVFALSDVLRDGGVKLSVKNDSKTPIFVNVSLDSYPLDVEKVKKSEKGIILSRTIEEVVDTKKLAECSDYYYYNDNKDCNKAFAPVSGKILKKGATYRITLKAKFDDGRSANSARTNFTFEDYLPATFRVMNSKFRTNSIATSQGTTEDWYYNRVEIHPDLIMAHAQYIWGDTAEYSYFVIPEFEGTFLYPPATAYLMYNPDVRAYGTFTTLEVK